MRDLHFVLGVLIVLALGTVMENAIADTGKRVGDPRRDQSEALQIEYPEIDLGSETDSSIPERGPSQSSGDSEPDRLEQNRLSIDTGQARTVRLMNE